MKKIFIALIVVFFACFIIASCVPGDDVRYCPYCSSSVNKLDDGYFQCSNSNCDKKFGAKEIK